jgi:hypothetical protein
MGNEYRNGNSDYYFVDEVEKSDDVFGKILQGILKTKLFDITLTNANDKQNVVEFYNWRLNKWSTSLAISYLVESVTKDVHIRVKKEKTTVSILSINIDILNYPNPICNYRFNDKYYPCDNEDEDEYEGEHEDNVDDLFFYERRILEYKFLVIEMKKMAATKRSESKEKELISKKLERKMNDTVELLNATIAAATNKVANTNTNKRWTKIKTLMNELTIAIETLNGNYSSNYVSACFRQDLQDLQDLQSEVSQDSQEVETPSQKKRIQLPKLFRQTTGPMSPMTPSSQEYD